MSVQSPVTCTTDTSPAEQFSTKEIIELYAHENVDVTRFFEGLNKIDLYLCEKTGYRFFYPPSIFGDNLFYQDLQHKISGYYHTDRWEHKKSKNFLTEGASLLEVGCGDGVFLNDARKICKNVKGLELNSAAVKKAKEHGLDVEEKLVQDFSNETEKKFDIVCAFQVLEHIYDIRSFLTAMIRCAKPGGLLIIAVPNNNPYLFKREKRHFLNLPPHHAGLWNEESLRRICGFFPLAVQHIYFEPLFELKMWYKVQAHYYEEKGSVLGKVMKLVPRQLYKPALRMFRNKIQGKTVLAIYKVNGHEG